MNRVARVDILKGFAMLLVVVDHLILVAEEDRLAPIRVVTRVAEPIFALSLGWALAFKARSAILRRCVPIIIGATASNLAFLAVVGQLDVLASFLPVYLLRAFVGRWLAFAAPAVFLLPEDGSDHVFDFPLALVVSQVALGGIRNWGGRGLVVISFLACSAFMVTGWWLTLGATAACAMALFVFVPHELDPLHADPPRPGDEQPRTKLPSRPGVIVRSLAYLGRRSLVLYVAQSLVIFGTTWLLAE